MSPPSEERRLDRPFWGVVVLVALAAVVVYLPALWAGFLADDLFQISLLEGFFGPSSPLDLYTFGDADPENTARHVTRGTLPWWTLPQWRFSMLRPLSSLLLAFDHRVFPRQPVVHHVHGMLWMLACVVTAAWLFRSVGGRLFAAVAVLVYAIDESFAWTVAWLANRCSMVSAAFVLLALAAHVRRRRETSGDLRLWSLELGAWSLAFAGGEYALSGLGYLFAYELAFARDGWRMRVRSMVPALVPAVVYAGVYLGLGFGVTGGVTYIDPIAYPREFLVASADRIPRMIGETWLGLPGEGEKFWRRFEAVGLSEWVLPLDGASSQEQFRRHARFSLLATLGVWVVAWLSFRAFVTPELRRTARFMALGSVLSLPPLAAVPPGTRALALPSVGVAAVVAVMTAGILSAWVRRPRGLRASTHRIVATVFTLVLFALHVPAEAYLARGEVVRILETHDKYMKFYGTPGFRDLDIEGKHVVVLATPGLVTGMHGLSMLRVLGVAQPRSWHVLAMGERPYLIRRLDPTTLEIGSVGGPLHVFPQEVLFRPLSEALQTGDEVDAGIFRARVLHARRHGPDVVAFMFDRSLDDRSLVFLEVGEEGLQPFVLPPIGRSIAIKPPQLPTPLPR